LSCPVPSCPALSSSLSSILSTVRYIQRWLRVVLGCYRKVFSGLTPGVASTLVYRPSSSFLGFFLGSASSATPSTVFESFRVIPEACGRLSEIRTDGSRP
jgi:hypothetical protein